jgi:RecA-family ATPase
MTERVGGASPFDDADLDRLIEENVFTGADAQQPALVPDEYDLKARWLPFTLSDAYKETSPTEFLIDGLLPIPSLSIVYGGPGSLKSMLLADMAVCVASGLQWLESLPAGDAIPGITFPTKQAPVLWIDFDNGRKRTHHRMRALGRGHDAPETVPLHYLSLPDPWLDASNSTFIYRLTEYVQAGGYRLVIIDNLGLVNGGTDENSGEMARVMSNLRHMSEDGNCAVIAIHHQRKGSSNTTDPGVRKGDTLRGHSTIEASLDMALLVERKGREDYVIITPTKVRDFQKFDNFGALWSYDHFADNQDMLRTGRFWSKAVATGDEAVNLAIMQTIKNELRGRSWTSGPDIVQLVRDRMAAKPGGKAPGINKVRGLLREMAENGQLISQGKARNLEYCLP